MSYSFERSATISGEVNGSFSYGASQSGGTEYVTLHWSEDIDIIVTVDDDPFQDGVSRCSRHLDALTASVVATEAAQLSSKAKAAEKVSTAVVEGFFGLIRSEIKQQMAEIAALLPPKLQEVNGLAQRCQALGKQMQRDYARIGERYARLFGDLDKEMRQRIQSVDGAAFTLRRQAGELPEASRSVANVITPMVVLKEREEIQALLLAHGMRQRALGMIQSARQQIAAGIKLSDAFRKIRDSAGSGVSESIHVPLVFMETDNLIGRAERDVNQVFPPGSPLAAILESGAGQIGPKMVTDAARWASLGPEKRKHLDQYLDARLSQRMEGVGDARSTREGEMVRSLWQQMCPSTTIGG